ncbi:MAG: BREX system Lon protease-like protein BrxL [Firmicutes bacterium]|nr:BREX system Lon protease-like protein BrxL [Bacillota bacterium]
MFEEKLKKHFDGMIVKKTNSQSIFASLSLPSFIRDWFLKKYADKNGDVNVNFISERIKEILPSKKEWNRLLDGAIAGEKVKFLGRIKARLDIKNGRVNFELPDFGITYSETFIPSHTWNKFKDGFLRSDEDVWGIIELGYLEAEMSPTKKGLLILKSFQCFRPYTPDLDYFKAVRAEFDFDEWLDVLLSAIDYNPNAYKTKEGKIAMLTRLLIFVEKRLNLIELAPKGTGKSYLFSRISKHGWLASGGVMTRAKMFYDMNRKEKGLVSGYDYIALDEISTIKFPDANEMQGALKGYLESGTFTVGNKSGNGDAGMILLGNIPSDMFNTEINMFQTLPPIFAESALIDRFHGFIEGWNIPRMSESMKVNGWALNTEYFSGIMNALRGDITSSGLVNKLVDVPKNSDTRDVTAVRRLTSAYLKLFFPHWKDVKDVNLSEFEEYCLKPAVHMRGIIKKQLCIIDKEYLNYPLPTFSIKAI